MILSFKKQFIEKVLSGEKKQTIRKDEKGRWQQGKKIHFATGVRTKNYHQFATGVCTKVQEFEIVMNDFPDYANFTLKIDGRLVYFPDDLIDFAKADGFDDFIEFVSFFGFDEFKGKLIHFELEKNN